MGARNKPKLFIASSSEALPVARALQVNLHKDLECIVWEHGVFGLSSTVLQELFDSIGEYDFAVFVFAADDKAIIRGKEKKKTRDNVLFELGLFSSRLGIERTFIVAPDDVIDFDLATDLDGLLYAPYNSERSDGNTSAALGVASEFIRRKVNEVLAGKDAKVPTLGKIGFFTDFDDVYPPLFQQCRKVCTYFIHSRRWRETHNHHIRDFLNRSGTKLDVYLPNLRNRTLISAIVGHFDDGPNLPNFIKDSIRYFKELLRQHPNKVRIMYYNTYPTYSFYKFDDELILAMYPTTPYRRDVPTFKINIHHPFGQFIIDDMLVLKRHSTPNSPVKKKSAIK